LRKEDGSLFGEAYMPDLRGSEAFLQGSAASLYDSEGSITGAIESIRNITERMKAQIELKNSEAKNRSLLDAIPDMIFLVSEDGTGSSLFSMGSGLSLYSNSYQKISRVNLPGSPI
jgi:PAS domain-containing protein